MYGRLFDEIYSQMLAWGLMGGNITFRSNLDQIPEAVFVLPQCQIFLSFIEIHSTEIGADADGGQSGLYFGERVRFRIDVVFQDHQIFHSPPVDKLGPGSDWPSPFSYPTADDAEFYGRDPICMEYARLVRQFCHTFQWYVNPGDEWAPIGANGGMRSICAINVERTETPVHMASGRTLVRNLCWLDWYGI